MKLANKISIFFVLIFIAAIAVAAVFELGTARRQQKNTLTILRGENALQIANDLKAEGYIGSKIIFLIEVINTENLRNLKSGEYDLKGLNGREIIDKIAAGRIVPKDITIIPGWTIYDIAKKSGISKFVSTVDFLAIVTDSEFSADFLKNKYSFFDGLPKGAGLEGYLYPDTYQISDKPKAQDVVDSILSNFDKKFTLDLRAEISRQKKTVFEIIIMASMIEKEVITIKDKKIVSGILWKRLDSGMRLQVDSTELYDPQNARYDTYLSSGLPQGPICNPGIESIQAAIYPEKSNYWYYLSAKDGTTIFSKTYGEHLINKAKFLD